ncbi:FAD-dependent oxidoreductase [Sporomusa sp.]|uniref:FAD-dependent oxidoreductase n=1 Tax=Sporomusa sp. TaxID=2078658 RepID=UPI002C385E23|nr:FAD-dependent oxidoreductase [Sporomusa sp.]HWR05604.1 FAD-dependent oxidoreductase [Sporomusa sp.]
MNINKANEIKGIIRDFVFGLGIDDVRFANAADYESPKSPKLDFIFPACKSMIVMAFREESNCESEDKVMAAGGRIDFIEFMHGASYKVARFVEKKFNCKAMGTSPSFPTDKSKLIPVGEVSQRHAAKAAGYAQSFARNNLVIHPALGRVWFITILTNMDLPSDPPSMREMCIHCNRCVDNCPGGALDKEGITDVAKCAPSALPFDAYPNADFLFRLLNSSKEEQQKMLSSSEYQWLFQGAYIGIQYNCFNCYARCPVGVESAPCSNACPAGIDVPIYLDHIRNGRFQEAYEEIVRENPLPGVCGRVCGQLCESECRRNQLDEPLAIHTLKRSAADWVLKHNDGRYPVVKPDKNTGKKVAIIGSGPSGLTAAHYLAKAGHEVTIFEARAVAGGALAAGIPEYRLPSDGLAASIQAIQDLGVTIKLNTSIGKDLSINDLKNGFDAMYISAGARKNLRLGVPGEDASGIYSGISFLEEAKVGKSPDLHGKDILVVGGGNVAIDAARTAKSIGAQSVKLVCLEQRNEMPAWASEITDAEDENIEIINGYGPHEFIVKDGNVAELVLKRCVSLRDEEGQFHPSYDEADKISIKIDRAIVAIGQAVDLSDVIGDIGITLDSRGRIVVNASDMNTGIPSIFAGGECVSGPDIVVNSIAQGKKAAKSMDKYLGGDGCIIAPRTLRRELSGELRTEKATRVKDTCIPVADRNGYAEVNQGFSESEAVAEASRCLRCDLGITTAPCRGRIEDEDGLRVANL